MILNWFLIDGKRIFDIHTEYNRYRTTLLTGPNLPKFASKDSENVILLAQQGIKSLRRSSKNLDFGSRSMSVKFIYYVKQLLFFINLTTSFVGGILWWTGRGIIIYSNLCNTIISET